MKQECKCSFCKLRKINHDNFLEQLVYLRGLRVHEKTQPT